MSSSFDSYFETFKNVKILTREEETFLHKKIKNGCRRSYELFVKSNLRLVVKISKYYENNGLEKLDLIQLGNIGLMYAIERFDNDSGFKFSTYASGVIKQHMMKGLTKTSKLIKITDHVRRKIVNVARETENVRNKLFKENITFKDLVNNSNFTEEQLSKSWFNYKASSPINFGDIKDPFDEARDFIDTITYDSLPTPEINVRKVETEEFLSLLSQIEKTIIIFRFGLMSAPKLSLREVGEMYDITGERVRQIQDRAISKMRGKI